jgi:hypothetical protein
MTYLVDSNFFIEAHRVTYPLDVVPSFWLRIADLANQGIICSIDKVKVELERHDDELTAWCNTHLPADFFKDSTISITEYGQTARWAVSKSDQYRPAALAVFLDADRADAWLVGYALMNNMTVVTQEVSSPDSKKNIKLPDACTAMDVPSMNTIDMLRVIGAKV